MEKSPSFSDENGIFINSKLNRLSIDEQTTSSNAARTNTDEPYELCHSSSSSSFNNQEHSIYRSQFSSSYRSFLLSSTIDNEDVIKEFRNLFLEKYLEKNKLGRKAKANGAVLKSAVRKSVSCQANNSQHQQRDNLSTNSNPKIRRMSSLDKDTLMGNYEKKMSSFKYFISNVTTSLSPNEFPFDNYENSTESNPNNTPNTNFKSHSISTVNYADEFKCDPDPDPDNHHQGPESVGESFSDYYHLAPSLPSSLLTAGAKIHPLEANYPDASYGGNYDLFLDSNNNEILGGYSLNVYGTGGTNGILKHNSLSESAYYNMTENPYDSNFSMYLKQQHHNYHLQQQQFEQTNIPVIRKRTNNTILETFNENQINVIDADDAKIFNLELESNTLQGIFSW